MALGANDAPALLDVSSSESALDATGDAESAVLMVDPAALADGLVTFAVTSGVDVAPEEVT